MVTTTAHGIHRDAPIRVAPGGRRNLLVLISLLILGSLLRLSGVERYAFEQDELYTMIESQTLFDSPLNPGIESRPLYYLIQHPFLDLMPPGHLTLRFLPIVFGVLGIAATWALGRKVGGNSAAIVATFVVVLSPWHLHASSMARYWSLIYLLSCLLFLYLLKSYADDRPRDYLFALLFLLLGTATHPTFIFPVVGFAAGHSLVRRDGRIGWEWPTRNGWLYLWIPFLSALAAAALALNLTGNSSAVQNWGSRGSLATARMIAAAADWSTPILVATGGLGALILALAASRPLTRRFSFSAFLGMLSCLALLTAAAAFTAVYADYAIAMLPLLVVSGGALVAAAVDRFSGPAGLFVGVALLILTAGMAPYSVSHLVDGGRFDYRPAFERIANTAPELPVLTMPIVIQRHYAPDLQGVELRMTRSYLDAQLEAEESLWVIAPVRRDGIWQDTAGELAGWLPEHCRLVETYQKPRFDYRMYRSELFICGAASNALRNSVEQTFILSN